MFEDNFVYPKKNTKVYPRPSFLKTRNAFSRLAEGHYFSTIYGVWVEDRLVILCIGELLI